MKERAITEIGSTVLSTVLRDEPWKDLGFGGRPRYGAFFQRFRSKWKVDLEKSALKEMIILLTTAHLVAEVIAEQDNTAALQDCSFELRRLQVA